MKKNLRLYLTFVFIILLAAFAVYIDIPSGSKISLQSLKINYNQQFKPRLGLDLEGGTELEYQGDLSNIPSGQQATAMDAARAAIENRVVNVAGIQEPLISTSGTDRLIVELPGIKNVDQAISIIGQTPFLEFRQEGTDPKNPWVTTGLTGKDLQQASVQFDPTTGAPQILLQFNSEGTKLFAQITQDNIGKPVAIFLDGVPLSTPTVQTAITNGQAVITGTFTLADAKKLVSDLNSGALPVPIKLVSQQTIGATLGQNSIQDSMVAGIIGIILIILFMIIYYRFPGALAVLALGVYGVLSFAIFKLGVSATALVLVGIFFLLGLTVNWFFGLLAIISYFVLLFLHNLSPVTLTLAGIAGFILSIGMAVDANILIFERTKEELRLGKDVSQALDDGFKRAWPSIRDSNSSSLITTAILYIFGTTEIRSFALTLGIGIIISLFTAITVTRTFLRMFVGHNIMVHPALFGGIKSKELEQASHHQHQEAIGEEKNA